MFSCEVTVESVLRIHVALDPLTGPCTARPWPTSCCLPSAFYLPLSLLSLHSPFRSSACIRPSGLMAHAASLEPGHRSRPCYCPHPQLLQLLATLSNHPSEPPSLTCPRGGKVAPRRDHKRMKPGTLGKAAFQLGLERRRWGRGHVGFAGEGHLNISFNIIQYCLGFLP